MKKNMKNKRLIIVSGLSGAGKSQALNILEDEGYFCIDNLPVELMSKFVDLFKHTKRTNFAIGLDIRSAQNLNDLKKAFKIVSFEKSKVDVLKLFMDADEKSLIKRFSETRRRHPLGGNLVEAIKKEKTLLEEFKKEADYVINSSSLNLSELKLCVLKTINLKTSGKINITVMSFGYKYGLPINADIILDTRFLPNPNYVEKLKNYTGKHKKVQEYVLSFELTEKFILHIENLLRFILPNFFSEGKNYLTIAFGCTGGQHRSVALAQIIYKFLISQKDICGSNTEISLYHRDVTYYE